MYQRMLKRVFGEARQSIIHEMIRAGEIPKPAGQTVDYHGVYQKYRTEIDNRLRQVVDELLLEE